jgi:amidophosphoribosyltransferase
VLKGKRVVVVDDSIVRGTTSRKIVKMLKAAGAVEVHLRISSPPTSWPCYYGIDTPSRQELIASNHTTEEIARYVTADTLGYLSLEGLGAAVGDRERTTFCTACFSGKYLAGEMSPETAAQSARPEPLPEAVASGSAVATGPEVLPGKHLTV